MSKGLRCALNGHNIANSTAYIYLHIKHPEALHTVLKTLLYKCDECGIYTGDGNDSLEGKPSLILNDNKLNGHMCIFPLEGTKAQIIAFEDHTEFRVINISDTEGYLK